MYQRNSAEKCYMMGDSGYGGKYLTLADISHMMGLEEALRV